MCLQVKFIPDVDLRAIDGLWRAASNGKFGYSVQKELWVQNRRYWERLFKAIDWTHGVHNFYRCCSSFMTARIRTSNESRLCARK